MKCIKIPVSVVCLWVYTLNSLYALSPVQINAGDRLLIGKHIEYYVDTTQHLDIGDLANKTFIPCQTEILNLGNTAHTVWMRFSVSGSTEKEIYLEIAAPLLSQLEIFEVTHGAAKQLFNGSSLRPFRERKINSENWLLDLALKDSAETSIYIKGQSLYPFQIPVSLSAKNKFVEVNQLHNLFWGLYIGVMIFAFIYNFFIYLSVKERIYLYYLFYILSSVLFYIGLEGFGFKFLWPNQPGVNPMVPVLVSITNCVITLFAFSLLQITRRQKVLYYMGCTFIGIFIVIAIMNIAGAFVIALSLSQLFSLLICFYFIALGIISLRRGVPSAKYFLIAWSAFLILVILFILALNNVVPSTFFNTHGIFLGHMAEVLLLSFALANRINILKAENEKKQREIIVQFEENQLLQTKVNRELEQKVLERTAELVAEKKEVEIQKKRSDDLLLNILPEEVAEELKTKGSAEAQLIDEVTVLFTDFKDFTQRSEKLSPKELVAEINVCFSAFDHIVQTHGVEKIKTVGDAYMAAGGLPTPNSTHAIDVVNAALAIQQFMEEYKIKREGEGKSSFEIRIGVHSGPVVAGIVGVKKFAYDIWGDTVNTASRMENNSEVGKVNISGTTYELVKDKFKCSYRGKIEAKGKGEIDMYFVEGSL